MLKRSQGPSCIIRISVAGSSKEKYHDQAPEEWKEAVRQRIKHPTLTLHDCGGGEVRITV